MATFCWEAESLSLAFIISVSCIVLEVASEIPFVFQINLFNPDLSFAVRRGNGTAGRELLLWKEIAEPGWLVWPCCVWMVGKKNAVWVWKKHFGPLLLSIKVYLSILISSLKGGKKPVFCFVCGEQTDAVWKTWEKGNEVLRFLPQCCPCNKNPQCSLLTFWLDK